MRGPRPPNPNMRPAYQGSNPVSDVWAKHALSIVSKYLKRLENYFYTVMSFMNDLSFLYVQIIGYILVGSRLIEGDDFFFLRNILFDPAHSKTNVACRPKIQACYPLSKFRLSISIFIEHPSPFFFHSR